jgi:RHS repeat-associated protein
MLEEMGIVHMNGRLVDPRLGRVMSADPIIQAPAMSQSYNRYSYVMNGPLSLTDPSGFSWWTDFRDDFLKPAIAIGIAIYAPQISGYLWGAEFGAATACYAGVTATQVAIVQGATAGFLAGAVTGGTIESAFYGGISGAAFGSLHGMDTGVGKIAAHGLAGGVMSRAQGGDFGSGFLASAFTQAASMGSLFGNPGEGTAMRAQNAIMAGIVGGTASVLGGGKFANGAVTGAMSRLLNDGFRDMVDEGKEQAKKVGRMNALRGYMDKLDAENDMLTSKLPGPHNGPADAFRHCDWSCRMTESIGIDNAKLVGDLHEAIGDAKGQPSAERVMDLSNNETGRLVGQTRQGCFIGCMNAYKSGILVGPGGEKF